MTLWKENKSWDPNIIKPKGKVKLETASGKPAPHFILLNFTLAIYIDSLFSKVQEKGQISKSSLGSPETNACLIACFALLFTLVYVKMQIPELDKGVSDYYSSPLSYVNCIFGERLMKDSRECNHLSPIYPHLGKIIPLSPISAL